MTVMVQENLNSVGVAELMRRAADGDRKAWERLVEQFARLIWSITAEFKLVESDAADVAQTTWLRLLEHIDRIQYPDRVCCRVWWQDRATGGYAPVHLG